MQQLLRACMKKWFKTEVRLLLQNLKDISRLGHRDVESAETCKLSRWKNRVVLRRKKQWYALLQISRSRGKCWKRKTLQTTVMFSCSRHKCFRRASNQFLGMNNARWNDNRLWLRKRVIYWLVRLGAWNDTVVLWVTESEVAVTEADCRCICSNCTVGSAASDFECYFVCKVLSTRWADCCAWRKCYFLGEGTVYR